MDDLLQFDLNGDGVVDDLDLDLNGNGVVNSLDFDVNGDGAFNNLDLDLNGDGVVNDLDFDLNGDGVFDNQDINIAQPMTDAIEQLNNDHGGQLIGTTKMFHSNGDGQMSGNAMNYYDDSFHGLSRVPGPGQHYTPSFTGARENIASDAVNDVMNSAREMFDGFLNKNGQNDSPATSDSPGELGTDASHAVHYGISSLTPASWEDGASYSEITPDVMKDMSEQMMELFGRYGIEVYEVNGSENAGMALGEDAHLAYDPNLLWTMGQRYGTDVIPSIIGHEVGHHMVETTIAQNMDVSAWQHEFCADYISGIISQYNGGDHSAMENIFSDPGVSPASDTHPNGGLRSEAYNLGVQWAQNHSDDSFIQNLQNPAALEDMFMNDIINTFPGSYGEYADI